VSFPFCNSVLQPISVSVYQLDFTPERTYILEEKVNKKVNKQTNESVSVSEDTVEEKCREKGPEERKAMWLQQRLQWNL
jgi:hypothetical protein